MAKWSVLSPEYVALITKCKSSDLPGNLIQAVWHSLPPFLSEIYKKSNFTKSLWKRKYFQKELMLLTYSSTTKINEVAYCMFSATINVKIFLQLSILSFQKFLWNFMRKNSQEQIIIGLWKQDVLGFVSNFG